MIIFSIGPCLALDICIPFNNLCSTMFLRSSNYLASFVRNREQANFVGRTQNTKCNGCFAIASLQTKHFHSMMSIDFSSFEERGMPKC